MLLHLETHAPDQSKPVTNLAKPRFWSPTGKMSRHFAELAGNLLDTSTTGGKIGDIA
jgi:hypothetical protein